MWEVVKSEALFMRWGSQSYICLYLNRSFYCRRCDWKSRNYIISHPAIQSEPMMSRSMRKGCHVGGWQCSWGTYLGREKVHRPNKLSVQELPLHGTHSGGQEWVPTHGKGGPKDHVEVDLKGRNEVKWALMSRRSWISGERGRHSEEGREGERSGTAHSRQRTEKPPVMTVTPSCSDTQQETRRDEQTDLRGPCPSSWAVGILQETESHWKFIIRRLKWKLGFWKFTWLVRKMR